MMDEKEEDKRKKKHKRVVFSRNMFLSRTSSFIRNYLLSIFGRTRRKKDR